MGSTVAIDGDRAVIGFDGSGYWAPRDGAAYLYERDSMTGEWLYAGTLSSRSTVASDAFGSSVSIDGDRVLIGAYGDDGAAWTSGAMYVFDRLSGGTWVESAVLRPRDRNFEVFGIEVVLHGDIAVGGCDAYTSAGGLVFVRRADGTWTESFAFTSTSYQSSVIGGLSCDGETILFGFPVNGNYAPLAGRAYSLALGTLQAGHRELSIADGGTQDLLLRAGSEHAARNYVILGSASGSTPGFIQSGPPFLHIPLNPDAYSFSLLSKGGARVLLPSSGVLDADGFADSALTLPPGLLPPSFAGLTLHHAYVVFEAAGAIAFHHASNAVAVTLGV